MTAAGAGRLRAFATLASILIAVGCAGSGRRALVSVGPPLDRAPTSWSALYAATVTTAEESRKFRLAVAATRDGYLRLEGLDPLGRSQALLAITPDRLTLLLPRERLHLVRDDPVVALDELVGPGLSPGVLAPLLTGEVDYDLDWSALGDTVLHAHDDGVAYDVRLSERLPERVEVVWPPSGGLERRLVVLYEAFRATEVGAVSDRLALGWQGTESWTLELTLQRFREREPADGTLFAPSIPVGFEATTIAELDALGFTLF